MYAVVGCNACNALWVVDGRPETTGCPRCGKRHRYAKLKTFAECETAAAAKEARSRLLADRGDDRSPDDLGDFETLAREAMDAGPDDEEYLEAAGVDADEAAAAGDRADSSPRSRSRTTVVRDALREGATTADEVADYAAARGVDPAWAREALDRLARRGEVTESGGEYRLL